MKFHNCHHTKQHTVKSHNLVILRPNKIVLRIAKSADYEIYYKKCSKLDEAKYLIAQKLFFHPQFENSTTKVTIPCIVLQSKNPYFYPN